MFGIGFAGRDTHCGRGVEMAQRNEVEVMLLVCGCMRNVVHAKLRVNVCGCKHDALPAYVDARVMSFMQNTRALPIAKNLAWPK